MNYKEKSLFDKIYQNFIHGEYGVPRIPTKDEVIAKLKEITTTDYIPITTSDRLIDIDITAIRTKFLSIIDDIDILYDSIESESLDILDQLTNSLKEYNGIKRELKKIENTNEDIISRDFDIDNLTYQFTESFHDLANIDIKNSDPADTTAGSFSIKSDTSTILTLDHHKGHKLEFSTSESYSSVLEHGYIGNPDAVVILDLNNPEQLVYRIKTSTPTKLRTSFVLQLMPDEKPVTINSVGIIVDSAQSKGYIRLYYRTSYQWKDVPSSSIKEIKNDKILFNFPEVEATHVKIEFIKDGPDKIATNEYFFIIGSLFIEQTTTKRQAKLQSKPIIPVSYSNEPINISTISASCEAIIPKTCNVKLWVSPDIKISGAFLDSSNSLVLPGSPSAYKFDPTYNNYVYLSDIINSNESISGVEFYRYLDYPWKEIKIDGSSSSKVPESFNLNNIFNKDLILNSLYTGSHYFFGDERYTGPWPIAGTTPDYFISGWCNVDNPDWSYLEPLVNSDILVSGIDIATKLGIDYNDIEVASGFINPLILADPEYSGQWLGYCSGLPFAFPDILYNSAFHSVDGWWRPEVTLIGPTNTGLDPDLWNTDPDFFFNNIGFYKIYRFDDSSVIEQSIKLYSYYTKPLQNSYPHSFIWSYNDSWTIGTDTVTNITPVADKITLSLLDSQELTIDGISMVKLSNSNVTFNPLYDYVLQKDSIGNLSQIDLTPIKTNYPSINISGDFFDYSYIYKKKNKYSSTWSSYIIVTSSTSSPVLTIKNFLDTDGDQIIGDVAITDIDNNISIPILTTGGNFTATLLKSYNKDTHYRIIINCLSDPITGFSAKIQGTDVHYVPFADTNETYISCSPGVIITPYINKIPMIDLSELIYNTTSNDIQKAAIYRSSTGERYIVVKKPSKKTFPGYYYDFADGCYKSNDVSKIVNSYHYVRNGLIESGVIDEYITYTTGSSGQYIYDNTMNVDSSWNNGYVLDRYPNTHTDINYLNIGSFNQNIHLDEINNNEGYLFYNTAENLPSYFSISYDTKIDKIHSNDRFLYKLELFSENNTSLTPIVKNIRFFINQDLV